MGASRTVVMSNFMNYSKRLSFCAGGFRSGGGGTCCAAVAAASCDTNPRTQNILKTHYCGIITGRRSMAYPCTGPALNIQSASFIAVVIVIHASRK
jgi:hypothetical protein